VLVCLFANSYAFLELLSGIGSAVGAIKPALEMFKHESKTSFGQLQQQQGFNNLNTHTEMGSGTTRLEKLPALFNFWIQNLPMEWNFKAHLSQIMQASEFEEFVDRNENLVQDFKFADGKGNIYYFKVVLAPHDTVPGVLKWEKVLWSAKYQVAAPFMVVTKSKSNFFSSSSKDEIRYFQAVLNPEHINALRSLSIPFMFVSDPSGNTLLDKH